MNKILRYSFVALMAMVFGNVMADDVIWSEDFSSYAKDEVPAGGDFSYVCVDGGSATKIYSEKLAGGEAPELLVGKKSGEKIGSFSATINLGSKSGDMTLSFKCNKNITIEVTGGTLGSNTGSGNDYVYPITGASGSLTIVFKNTLSNNARLDNIKLAQGQGKKPAGLSWGTSARTVTIGADDNVFPTLSNENNLAVTYASSEQTVATIAADGTITLVAAGETTISATSEATDEFEAGKAEYKLTVKEVATEKTVANIAALNALKNNDIFSFTGEALVVYVNGSYAYVKDETGSSLIYDKDKTKLAKLAVGKKVAANWTGKVSIYNKLFEAIPDAELAVTDAAAVDVTYPTAAITDVVAANMNQVVILKDVTYTVPEEGDKNFTISKGETVLKGYNRFGLEIAAPAEGATYNVTGVISVYNDDAQFQPIAIEVASVEPTAAEQKVLKITSTQQYAAFNLCTTVPILAEKYQGFKVEYSDITGTPNDYGTVFQVVLNSAEKKDGTDWQGKPAKVPVYTQYCGFLTNETSATFDFSNFTDEKGCSHIGEFTLQSAGAAPASIILKKFVLIKKDGTEVPTNYGGVQWGYEVEEVATGITNINAAKAENAVRYNLAGQKVNNDYKGVVIMNGKKMLNK